MDAVFYFSFYDHSNSNAAGESASRLLAFYISNILRPWSDLAGDLADASSELELEYGAHDLVAPLAGVNAIGYYSSEVEVSECDALMERYRQEFLNHSPGCVVSNVFDVPDIDNMNDADILKFTKDAYEHQQSQQLRDTLNTHVSPGQSTAIKKI